MQIGTFVGLTKFVMSITLLDMKGAIMTTTTNPPVLCAICSRLLIQHFAGDGTWQGCYPLNSDRAIVQAVGAFMQAPRQTGDGGRHYATVSDPALRAQPAPRVIYKPKESTSEAARKKTEKALGKLRGQVRVIYDLLADKSELGSREIARITGIKVSSVEHALWRLKNDGLVETVPAA